MSVCVWVYKILIIIRKCNCKAERLRISDFSSQKTHSSTEQ